MAPDSTEEISSPLDIFWDMQPGASIVNCLRCDLDFDGEPDYIILYTRGVEDSYISAGLAVCSSNSLCSGIDLSSDTHYTFNSDATLSFEDDVPVISFKLKDPEDGTIYDYHIQYTISEDGKDANYAISADAVP